MNFYNDIDPHACAWLKELMERGLIPPGVIDNRSITDIDPNELTRYTQCQFFAGIGGWPLALQWSGWPENRPVWTGSCPCQPFSVAGKRKGESDERHLWPAFRDIIAKCRPPVCFGEQVASADGREWLVGVRADLEALGYAVGAADLCAAGVGAPHKRQRLYWVAGGQTSRGGNRKDELLMGGLVGWPTPMAGSPGTENYNAAGNTDSSRKTVELVGWPTCSARDWKDTPGMAETGINPDGTERTRLDQLPRVAQLASWATPRAEDAESAGMRHGRCVADTLSAQAGQDSKSSTAATAKRGVLNPDHSRWLMGYPAEWGSCGATAM